MNTYLDNSSVIFFRWENAPGWPVLYASRNVTQMFDATAQDFLDSKIMYSQLIHPDDIHQVSREVIEASKTDLDHFKHKPYRVKSKTDWIWVEDTTLIIRDTNGDIIEYYGYISNLNEYIDLEHQLESLVKVNTALTRALDESYIVSKSDAIGTIIYVNNKFCKISGYTKEELLGQPHSILRHNSMSSSLFKTMWETISSNQVWQGVIRNKRKDGTSFYVDMTITPLTDSHGEIIEYIAIRHDISKLILTQNKQKKILTTSTIGNIPNRVALLEYLTSMQYSAAAQVDIDAFHEINDFFGYKTGDAILKELSHTLWYLLANKAILYHLHSDRFVFVSTILNHQEFLELCKEVQYYIHQKTFTLEEKEFSIRVTLSISFEENKNILRSLDMANEYAKKKRTSLMVYSEECDLSSKYNAHLKCLHKLKLAFTNNKILPYYQAIYDIKAEKIKKYECLARIIDDEENGAVLTPYYFLATLYKAKMNKILSKVMINKTFQHFMDTDYEFSVNLSVSDITNDDFVLFVIEKITTFSKPQNIIFEILESESIENFALITKFIEQVKALKCKIAIDDFGSGYANFENLLKLDADIIKIDGSLIKEIDKNQNAYDIVETILAFAKKKSIKTVAEFVSSKEIFDVVCELGFDYAQGYFIAPPQAELCFRENI